MKLLQTSALFGALLFGAVTLNAATAAPVKPPAKGAAEKTNPPTDAYGAYSFDKAKAEAEKKKKPIAILLTDERADDAAVKAATNKSYWTFWDDAVVVILRNSTADAWGRLPDPIQKAARTKELGTGYPRLVGFDESATTPLMGMKPEQLVTTDEKSLDKIAKSFKNANKTKAPLADFPPPSLVEPAKPAPATPPATAKTETKPATPGATPAPPAPAPATAAPAIILIKDGKPESWTNAQGQTMQATLAEAGADKVVFVMPNGTRMDYDIAKLSDASKKRVEELKAASTPK
jgi:hypothetical protein